MATKFENATICWSCGNCTKCDWSKGIPMEGWEATPTKIKNISPSTGKVYYTDSFCVRKCPQFKEDVRKVTLFQISQIIKEPNYKMHDYIKSEKGLERLRIKLLEFGYKLHIYRLKTKREYYVEKLL